MRVDELADRLTQFLDAAKGPPVQCSAFKLCEPALDGVEPRGTRGCEVQLDARVLGKPSLDLGRLVCGAIVQNHVQVQCRVGCLIDLTHEIQELLGAMPLGNAPHHIAGQHIEGGIQAGCAMALVVMGALLQIVGGDKLIIPFC